jgi:hypothetical protein
MAAVAACGQHVSTTISTSSAAEDAPDLSLRGVAFARMSEGRMVARGTAARLDYRRAGGRLYAEQTAVQVVPEAGTALASLGALRIDAPLVDGEVASRRGNASGGVRLAAERGDRAVTESVQYDGDFVRSRDPVAASGPGYAVEGHGLVARTDGSSIDLRDGVQGQLEMEAHR